MPEKRNVLAFQDCVDADPEVREWQEAIASVIVFEGGARADEILGKTVDVARRQGTNVPFAAKQPTSTPSPRTASRTTRATARLRTACDPPFAGTRSPWS